MKLKLRILFGVTAALTAVAALAFVNNVVALARWWRLFLAAGGDTTSVPSHVAGCFPWLDWSAVDYSSVTTLIPLIGLVCLCRAAWKLLRGRTASADDFPFFHGSDQLYIALGLFGTLWGIIVIGYFKLDTVTMADLMQCLHTALFSTLMAVVWVFFLDRPLVRPYFRRLLLESGLALSEADDLAAGVDRLVKRLDEASAAFAKRQAEYEAAFAKRQGDVAADFEKRQGDYEAAFERRRQAADDAHAARAMAFADETNARRAALDEEMNVAQRAFEKRLADYQAECDARQREFVEVFKRRLAELENRAEAAEKRAEAADRRVAEIAKIARSWN